MNPKKWGLLAIPCIVFMAILFLIAAYLTVKK